MVFIVGVLKILQIPQKNTCVEVIKLQNKELQHTFFPVKFGKFLRTSFISEHRLQLLLFVH